MDIFTWLFWVCVGIFVIALWVDFFLPINIEKLIYNVMNRWS